MPDRTVLVMGGRFQKEFKHEVPKIAGGRGQRIGRRINITFRQFEKLFTYLTFPRGNGLPLEGIQLPGGCEISRGGCLQERPPSQGLSGSAG